MTPYISLADSARAEHRHLLWCDVVRAVAIVMVLAEHTLLKGLEGDAWLSLKMLLTSDANLFFVLSGALLLPVADGGTTTFFRRRMRAVFIPYLVWSVLSIFTNALSNGYEWPFVSHQLRWVWIVQWDGYYWFVHVMIGLYLLAPFISPWLRIASRRSMQLFLALWGAAQTLPYLDIFNGMAAWSLDGYHMSMLWPFYSYTGYMVMGVYLRRWPVGTWRRRTQLTVYGAAVAVGVVMPFMFMHHSFTNPDNALLPMRYDTLTTAALTFIMYTVLMQVRTLPSWPGRAVTYMATLSYGIYLSHSVVTSLLYYYGVYPADNLAAFGLILALSTAVTAFFHSIPPLRRLLT